MLWYVIEDCLAHSTYHQVYKQHYYHEMSISKLSVKKYCRLM